ncbi:MAG: glycosyltransferase family 2 protein [Chlamydiae bacterium]|nr:glycosyltransferase family 2 protein [Chlamydiota bacterium]
MLPSLSVILCNYNHAHYLGESLRAILEQSVAPTEVIVVDDGSTDNSVEVIKNFQQKYSVLRLIQNEKNKGVLFSGNYALRVATSDYVYFAAADDKVLPGFFEKSMTLLEKYPQAGLCCSDAASFCNDSTVLKEWKLLWSHESCYLKPAELAKVIQGGFIPGNASILKRSSVVKAGGLIPELKWHCDWFLQLLVGFREGICYIPESLAALRMGTSASYSAGRSKWLEQEKVLDSLMHLLKSSQYQDVYPFFKKSYVLAHFGPEIVKVVLGNRQHWDWISLSLMGRQILREIRRFPRKIISLVTPSLIKQWYKSIRYGI